MSVLGTLLGRPSPEAVVRDHGPQVYRHLKRIFGPGADVDDVYQIVFVEVLRSLPTFKGRSKLSTWIRRITWNVAYQEMRMSYRNQRLSPLDEARPPLEHVEDAEEVAARRQAMTKLYKGIQQLDPKQRAAVLMHDLEGRTLREISEHFGRPLQTVASQLHAGRKHLTQWMQGKTPPARKSSKKTKKKKKEEA